MLLLPFSSTCQMSKPASGSAASRPVCRRFSMMKYSVLFLAWSRKSFVPALTGNEEPGVSVVSLDVHPASFLR